MNETFCFRSSSALAASGNSACSGPVLAEETTSTEMTSLKAKKENYTERSKIQEILCESYLR
jgi:hypothetical protein